MTISKFYFTHTNKTISNTLEYDEVKGKSLVFKLLDPPVYGLCLVDGNTREWTYNPPFNLIGNDSFTLEVIADGVSYLYEINIQVSNPNVVPQQVPAPSVAPQQASSPDTSGVVEAFITLPGPSSAITYGTIPNVSYLGYTFTVDPSVPDGAIGSMNSNVASTTISMADIVSPGNFTKYVDKAYAGKGDILAYNLVAANTGNVTANNVVITDIIPLGASYVPNSLTVNGVPSGYNPNTGIIITSIPAGASAAIAFSALVNSYPPFNPLVNTASIVYTFTQDPSVPNGISAATLSNSVSTTITYADLFSTGNFIKTTSTAQTGVGNTFTYSFFVTNSGNTTANNVLLQDTLPNGISFVPGSLQINSSSASGDVVTGVTLPDIGPGQVVSVSFNVLANTLPVPNPVSNAGHTSYTFTQDPSVPDGANGSATSNLVYTQIIPTVSVVKSASPQWAMSGDTINYTVVISNPNNIALNTVTFNDPLSSGVIFVPGSVMLNNVNLPAANIISGFSIGTINPGASVTVQFRATVSATASATVPNVSNISYRYTSTGLTPVRTLSGQSDSNVNVINIANASVSVTKSTPLTTVTVGSTIPYTVTIHNNGQLNLYDVTFRDIFPNQVSLLTTSFTINGNPVNVDKVTLEKGVDTGVLPVGATTTITFTVFVKPCCQNTASYKLTNEAYFLYTYMFPDFTGGTRYSPIATSVINKI